MPERLGLEGITAMRRGPIGFAVASRHVERYRALIIGNTWGWRASTLRAKLKYRLFGALWGGPPGRLATRRFNLFVRVAVPAGHKRRSLTPAEMAHYGGPFPDPASRGACSVFPREIAKAAGLLEEVEAGMLGLSGLPALILWADAALPSAKTTSYAGKNLSAPPYPRR